MNANERDERLERLLGATRASANPAVLARVRERLAARAETVEPAWLRFLGRPIALATACGLLAVSLAVSLQVIASDRAANATATVSATTNTSLVAALLDDDGTYGIPTSATGETSTTGDSNGVTP